MKELEDENQRLVGPMQRMKKKMNDLKVQLINYQKDKEMLKVSRE